MNLYAKLCERAAQGRALRIGLIGAGKFGAMYLAQAPKTPGIHVAGIADLSPANARTNLARVGWPAERYAAVSLDTALRSGATRLGKSGGAQVRSLHANHYRRRDLPAQSGALGHQPDDLAASARPQ